MQSKGYRKANILHAGKVRHTLCAIKRTWIPTCSGNEFKEQESSAQLSVFVRLQLAHRIHTCIEHGINNVHLQTY
jgi:hypothetical protein